MKKESFLNLLNSLLYLVVFLLIINNSLSYLDPDLGWHIKVGEEIYQSQSVPSVNHYNFVFSGDDNHWVDHEWLSNLLVYFVYNNFGYLTLSLFFALILFSTLLILNRFISKRISSLAIFKTFLISLELLLLKGLLPSSGIRVQEISWLFFSLLLLILFNFEERVLQKKKKPYLILGLFIPLFFLWTNLHGSFFLGPITVFIYLITKVGEIIIVQSSTVFLKKLKSFFNLSRTLERKNIFHLIFFLILGSAACILNPYGLKLFSFLFVYGKNSAYLSIIQEWFSPLSLPLNFWNLLYLVIFLVLFLYFFISTRKKEKLQMILSPWNLVLNLVFLILFIKSRRHFPLFFIVSFPSLAAILWIEIKNFFPNTGLLCHKKTDLFLKIFIITSITISGSSLLLSAKFNQNPFRFFCKDYPCYAVDFLKNQEEKYSDKKLLNDYNWGGYLIYEYPERKIFIDGRLPQKTFKNHSYVEEYLLFFSNSDDLIKEKLDEHEIELVLLPKRDLLKLTWLEQKLLSSKVKFLARKDKLKDFLDKESAWTLVYQDQASLIYEKTN